MTKYDNNSFSCDISRSFAPPSDGVSRAAHANLKLKFDLRPDHRRQVKFGLKFGKIGLRL